MVTPYERSAEKLAGILLRWIRQRRPDLPEELARRVAMALAMACVLAAEYGAGDAFAGYLLEHMDAATRVGDLRRVLLDLGVRNVPEPRWRLYIYCIEVMKRADFGDPEVNKAMRQLYDMALSGGRLVPDFMKDGG